MEGGAFAQIRKYSEDQLETIAGVTGRALPGNVNPQSRDREMRAALLATRIAPFRLGEPLQRLDNKVPERRNKSCSSALRLIHQIVRYLCEPPAWQRRRLFRVMNFTKTVSTEPRLSPQLIPCRT